MTTVSNSSDVSLALPTVLFKHCFTDFTKRSNIPPHQGALSKLKIHLMRVSKKYLVTVGCAKRFRRTLCANLNVFPLSESTRLGNPHLAVNRLKQLIKASVVIFGMTSKWAALVAQQVYKQIHTFLASLI